MELGQNFIAPRMAIPFHHLELPEDEARLADSLMSNLLSMERQSVNLSSALALWDFSETLPVSGIKSLAIRWRFLAMREGALCLCFYIKALEAVCTLQGSVPSLRPFIDMKIAAVAKRDFRARFKLAERLRHTVAHQELYANPDEGMGPNPPEFECCADHRVTNCCLTTEE